MAIVSRIQLRDFRNLAEVDVPLGSGLHVLVGDNGHGKTSILEAIHFLALLRSFRTRRPSEMINWQASSFKIHAVIEPARGVSSSFDRHEVAVTYSDSRQLLKDDSSVRYAAEFINSFLCVALVPEDIGLVKGVPILRRRFLDMLLCQLDRDYLRALVRYNRALAGRNTMLKQPHRYSQAAINAYDSVLAETGARLTHARSTTVALLHDFFQASFAEISDNEEDVTLTFRSSIFPKGTQGAPVNQLEKNIFDCLVREYDRDMERGTTRFGPHRDDLVFSLKGRNLASFGSEGQCRLATLAVKLAALRLLTEQARPDDVVLLVDDVFGELDDARRSRFFQTLSSASQAIVTCTSMPSQLESRGRMLKVVNGQLYGDTS